MGGNGYGTLFLKTDETLKKKEDKKKGKGKNARSTLRLPHLFSTGEEMGFSVLFVS